MASYVVMEPEGLAAADAAERARLVRDGFSAPAFLVPPLWLIWHGLPAEAAVAALAMASVAALGELTALGPAAAVLSFGLSLFVGMEGAALRLAALRRRGFRDAGVVDAGSSAEAELRHAAAASVAVARSADPQPAPPAPGTARSQGSVPVLGLLGYGGR